MRAIDPELAACKAEIRRRLAERDARSTKTALKRPPEIDGDIVRIHLTRGKVAIVDLVDLDLGRFNWRVIPKDRCWYASRVGFGRNEIYLHRAVADRAGIALNGEDVDHRDVDGLNCRRSNLRAATSAQNNQNHRLSKSNVSGVKGVSWDTNAGKWFATIRAFGVATRLGHFDNIEDAAAAYAAAALKYHGEFARLG